jgi:hypothetical protein
MRTMRFVMTTTALGLVLAAPAFAETYATETRVASRVEVRDVRGDATSISGRLVNLTGRTLANLKLSVNDTFLWTNERTPGSNDPSQAESYLLRQQIPAKSSVPFTVFRKSPLPMRSDGQFQTKVEVMGMSEQGAGSY